MWQPYDTRPRDATVLLTVEATAENRTFQGQRLVNPAYIDEGGAACDPSSCKPDFGLNGTHWRAVAWMALPDPAPADLFAGPSGRVTA
jgi:hypothetical protein